MRISLMAFLLALSLVAFAQETAKPSEDAAHYVCDQQRALSLIREQLAEAKASDNQEAYLKLHLTAADLLWPHRRDLAREWFEVAWETSRAHFKEKGIERKQSGKGLVSTSEDMRFVAIRAIARRDQAWASKLLKEVLAEQDKAAKEADPTKPESPKNNDGQDSLPRLAMEFLEADQNLALMFARQSLGRPGTASMLTRFLNALADDNLSQADAFCREAIPAQPDTLELFYLSAYVFGRPRPVGPQAMSVWIEPSKAFKPNLELQRFYVQAVLRRAQTLAANPAKQLGGEGAYRMPEAAQLTLGLFELEALLAPLHPALASVVAEARQSLSPLIAAEQATQVQDILQARRPQTDSAFERELKAAADAKTPARRDQHYAIAVSLGAENEPEEEVEAAAQKINHLATREQVFNFMYFKFAQRALKRGEYDHVFKLAEKVGVLEQRAYLFYEVAETALEKTQDRLRAQESLQAAGKAAERAPDNNDKARAYLGIANVYAAFDRQAAFEALAAAVKTLNQVKDPDVQTTRINQKVEGEQFGFYTALNVKGFDLNLVFQALGRRDFETALSLASQLQDKNLRAAATIALSSDCLSQPSPKPTPAKAAAPVKQK